VGLDTQRLIQQALDQAINEHALKTELEMQSLRNHMERTTWREPRSMMRSQARRGSEHHRQRHQGRFL
jgi:hypothetical protein